jgi:dephospho-CoA kinase
MLKVGITGNIGSGKTTVSKIFHVLGIPVFYADDEAKKVMTADAQLIAGIRQSFGAVSYFDDGTLNRKHIAGIVFNNADELAKLNALVHPAVFRAFDNWVAEVKDVPYVLKEAALLFESKSYLMCDTTLMVTAPLNVRMERVMKRDGITYEEALSRNARQFAEDEKVKMAEHLVINNDTQLVIPQVLALHEQFLALARTK